MPQAADGAAIRAAELAAVRDTGGDPGDETLILGRLLWYFAPDYDAVADDDSMAEATAMLADPDFTSAGH